MNPWRPLSWPLGPRPAQPGKPSCGYCGAAIKPTGPSLDFCNSSHQSQWMALQANPIEWNAPAPADDRLFVQRVRERWGLPGPGEDAA